MDACSLEQVEEWVADRCCEKLGLDWDSDLWDALLQLEDDDLLRDVECLQRPANPTNPTNKRERDIALSRLAYLVKGAMLGRSAKIGARPSSEASGMRDAAGEAWNVCGFIIREFCEVPEVRVGTFPYIGIPGALQRLGRRPGQLPWKRVVARWNERNPDDVKTDEALKKTWTRYHEMVIEIMNIEAFVSASDEWMDWAYETALAFKSPFLLRLLIFIAHLRIRLLDLQDPGLPPFRGARNIQQFIDLEAPLEELSPIDSSAMERHPWLTDAIEECHRRETALAESGQPVYSSVRVREYCDPR